MDKIRFGMIGAGAISNAHIPAILKHPDAEIVCLADVNEEAAKAQAEKLEVPRICASYDTLMEMDDVDAVIVGIPTQFHADAVIKAARAGKHAMCEKPMARTLEDCRAMIQAHDDAGTTLAMGFVRRYDQHWGQIRKLIHEGKAGRPCMWRVIVAGSAPQPPNYGTWYADERFSDGTLTESASHDVDFLRYTFGEVETVTAHMQKLGTYGTVLDNCVVIFGFESGDTALLHWSWSLPSGASSGFRGLDVIGPEGSIHEPRQIDDQWIAEVSRADEVVEQIPFENRRDATTWSQGQLDGFIRAIRGEALPRATGYDGYKAQEIYLAAVQSMESGLRIRLPLE